MVDPVPFEVVAVHPAVRPQSLEAQLDGWAPSPLAERSVDRPGVDSPGHMQPKVAVQARTPAVGPRDIPSHGARDPPQGRQILSLQAPRHPREAHLREGLHPGTSDGRAAESARQGSEPGAAAQVSGKGHRHAPERPRGATP